MEVQETVLLKIREIVNRGAASQKLPSKKFLTATVTLAVKILTLVGAHQDREMIGTHLTN